MLHSIGLLLLATTGPCPCSVDCEARKDTARVLICTEPQGAEVFVDGKKQGTAPVEIDVAAGSVLIGAENGKGLVGAKRVKLEPSSDSKRISVPLTSAQTTVDERPWSPSWPVLGVGASVIGVGAGLGYAGGEYNEFLPLLLYVTGGLILTSGLFPDLL